jgi:hypothetical protein
MWRAAMWAVIATLLVLPLVGMQFTREVAWTPFDFAAAAVLLGGAGVVIEVITRRIASPAHRILLAGLVVAGVALVWIEGAAGILD